MLALPPAVLGASPSDTAAITAGRPSPDKFPPCDRFVFGWSTGHVATLTLASEGSYTSGPTRQKSDVMFVFEDVSHQSNGARAPRHPLGGPESRVIRGDQYYAGMDMEAQAEHVREKYLPSLVREFNTLPAFTGTGRACEASGSCTCADLSHSDLFFADGLMKQLIGRANVTFVRVRRPAIELARSLEPMSDLDEETGCTHHYFEYCPVAKGASAARLAFPIAGFVWKSMTRMQRAFWIGDETEAQWRRLEKTYSGREGVTFETTGWATQLDNMQSGALADVAKMLGLKVTEGDHKSNSHPKESETKEAQAEADAYEAMMAKHCDSWSKEKSALRWKCEKGGCFWEGQEMPGIERLNRAQGEGQAAARESNGVGI